MTHTHMYTSDSIGLDGIRSRIACIHFTCRWGCSTTIAATPYAPNQPQKIRTNHTYLTANVIKPVTMVMKNVMYRSTFVQKSSPSATLVTSFIASRPCACAATSPPPSPKATTAPAITTAAVVVAAAAFSHSLSPSSSLLSLSSLFHRIHPHPSSSFPP